MTCLRTARMRLFKFGLLFVVALLTLACQSKNEKSAVIEQDFNVAHTSEKEIGSYLSRAQMVERLKGDQFDLLIIGGGATGAGAALDAASRGLKTALVEAGDFSSGTSSRSTKLIHGGVRYLENAVKHLDKQEYDLVSDALHERKQFLENAPHLTSPIAILTPVYGWFEAIYYLIGLKLYDFVAGNASLGSSQLVSREETLKRFSLLKSDGLKGSVLYYDGQFNDARMNITLILSAMREGAVALNYVRAENLLKQNGMVAGAVVKDEKTGQSFNISAKAVINATGIYADSIRKMDEPNAHDIMVPSQGSHIILPKKFSPEQDGLIIPKTKDGRVIFLLPWQGRTLAGTTDQPESISEAPKARTEEVDYILEHLRIYFGIPAQRSDVIATWSGLRPLAKPEAQSGTTAMISRDHLIVKSPSNLITIVGGKWTTYRKMAEEVVDAAITAGDLSVVRGSQTKNLKLVGARFYNETLAQELVAYEELAPDIALHLANSYGDRVDIVIDMNNKSQRQRLVDGFPYIEAEVSYAVQHEYAVHAVDVLARRTRLAFLDNFAARSALSRVVSLMAKELSWSEKEMTAETDRAVLFLDTMLTEAVSN